MSFKPSKQQLPIIAHATTGTGNALVVARAGSGKTTAIEQAVRAAVDHAKAEGKRRPYIGVFQFNATIAKASQERMGDTGADIRTLHSFGFAAVRRALGKVSVDNDKMVKILDKIVPIDAPAERRGLIRIARHLASLARASLATTPEAVDALADAFDVVFPPGEGVRDAVVGYVGEALSVCARCDNYTIDFDDMVWLPVIHDLKPAFTYDLLFIDETQDLSPCQIELVLRAAGDRTRVIAVGDDRQSIYGWRGADSLAVERVRSALNAATLPLTVTYRCARAIVSEANAFVPDLECAPGATEGTVRETPESTLLSQVRPGDYVLSRTNAPLVRHCWSLLSRGVPAIVAGRDVAASLISAIDAFEGDSVAAFLSAWTDHTRAEVERLEKAQRDTTYTVDKLDCLVALCEGETSLRSVRRKVDSMFGRDDDGSKPHASRAVTLSTAHRAKGMERERVFLLRSTFQGCAARARTDAQRLEEDNLMYVAITRARSELVYVN